MITKKALLGMTAVMAIMGSLLVSCTKQQQEIVRDVVRIADKACVIIRHVGPNGILQEICAYEEELSPLVPVILTGRARKASAKPGDAGAEVASAAAAAPSADQCKAACAAACQ